LHRPEEEEGGEKREGGRKGVKKERVGSKVKSVLNL